MYDGHRLPDRDAWVSRRFRSTGTWSSPVDLLAFTIGQNLQDSALGREFFIRKAIGWALREHAKTDRGWAVAFVAPHEAALSGLSRREALKNLG